MLISRLLLIVYRWELGSRSALVSQLLRPIRKLLNRLADPVVENTIWGIRLKHNVSHMLPFEVKRKPYYNYNILVLAETVLAVKGKLVSVDVGANIGDTAALIQKAGDHPLLCIEGEKGYLGLLRENLQGHPQVEVESSYIGETRSVVEIVARGTTELRPATGRPGEKVIQFKDFSLILDAHPRFKETNLLKIDTDGFDGLIIKNALSFLAQQQPVLFYEHDVRLFIPHGYNGQDVFDYLRQAGYTDLLFFYNNGDYYGEASLAESVKLKQYDDFFQSRPGAMFADIAAFAPQDRAIKDKVIAFYQNLPSPTPTI